MCVLPLNCYPHFKSHLNLSFIWDSAAKAGSREQHSEAGLWGMTEQGGVNIRARHSVPEVCGPAALSPPCLLSFCQPIKDKSLPIPTGIPHQTAQGAFYPKQNAAPCHSGGSATSCTQTAKFNTAEWKSISCRRGIAQTQEGEIVKRSQEKWDLEWHSLSETKQLAKWCQGGLMSWLTLSTMCQFWCLTIKAKHLIFAFSTIYCKGYCFSCKLSFLYTNLYLFLNKETTTISFCFTSCSQNHTWKGLTAHPKDTQELFILWLVLLCAFFNLGQKGRELLLLS